jgi:hypothetical protein
MDSGKSNKILKERVEDVLIDLSEDQQVTAT